MTTQDTAAQARLRRVAMLAAQAGKSPAQITRAVITQVKRDAAARRRAMLAGGQEEPAQESAESATTDQTPTNPAKARRRAMLGLKETN
ncbi:hypothetical protein C7C45_04905 [Micromonospora arborensis]|uniref:Uncharacterized protein n=1 Tax=Micromonospora arborensis TaxID=2116518 RepID=A0A318P843_9ACTN|nr:hypothetical protein [Micromonospora arborensis]PYC75210.1 hypothetical protein C7C45_04905 [Micromonospora arborensis]